MDQATAADLVYCIGCGAPDRRPVSPALLGGKAAGLQRMAESGLPVPPAFVLATTLCQRYQSAGRRLPDDFAATLADAVSELEHATGLSWGGTRRPLLVSVRSGAAVSMPGMMDTLLNIGLTDETLPALIRMTGNPRHAWDSYRRLIQSYTEIVHGVRGDPFERLLEEQLAAAQAPNAQELDVAELRTLVEAYRECYARLVGQPFPQQPAVQLQTAIEAVLRSWESARAVEYRRLHRLGDLGGTAVTVQAMVFGNMGGTSGSGVTFTRDPASGAKRLYLDFAHNAQGEDVVSGRCLLKDAVALETTMPQLFQELLRVGTRLEERFGDMQDFEFTVQEGRLYLLQARRGKRTPWAALRIACDLVAEGLISPEEALKRLSEYKLEEIVNVRLASAEQAAPLGRGTPAGPGVAVGPITLDPEEAVRVAATGIGPILVRTDITTADLRGLAAAAGVLTTRGGHTAHAAVVARQLNKVCIVGCRDLFVANDQRRCRIAGQWFAPGDTLSLDGHTGNIFAGKLEVVIEKPTELLAQVAKWQAGRAG